MSTPWRGCLHSARPAWRAPWRGAGWADDPSSTGTPGRPASWARARLATQWAAMNEWVTNNQYMLCYSLKCLTVIAARAQLFVWWDGCQGQLNLLIFIRWNEGTGLDFNHQAATQLLDENAGTHLSSVSYSHLRSAFDLPRPVHDGSFVGPHVTLAPRLQHAEELLLPVLLLWFLILIFRQDDPRLNERHTLQIRAAATVLLFVQTWQICAVSYRFKLKPIWF